MSRAHAADLAAGRVSSSHPRELRLVVGGAAYPGETVVWYRADYASASSPGAPLIEVRRYELARYVVRAGDNWHAPDLCSGAMYYAVLVKEDREEAPLEWEHLRQRV